MFGDESRKFLASYLVTAYNRAKPNDSNIKVTRDPVCDSPSVTIEFANKSYSFMFGRTPFNSESAQEFIDNKWKVYQALQGRFPVPYTEAIAKNDATDTKNLKSRLLGKINNPDNPLKFPIVLKPNMGSLGKDVFIVDSPENIEDSLNRIRSNKESGRYILMQQFMGDCDGAFTEMRAICLDGRSQIVFERKLNYADDDYITDLVEADNVVSHIEDDYIINQIDQIAQHLYDTYDVSYVAFDLKCDRQNKIWVLEGNSSPTGLSRIELELSNGRELIDNLTDKMIQKMAHQSGVDDTHKQQTILEQPSQILPS